MIFMRACVIQKYGGIEELKIKEMPHPKPAAGEVLVEVNSASLNHLDIWVRKGSRGNALKMPHIIGSDASGIVREAGNNVLGLNIGEEIILYPGLNCGSCNACLKGEQTECNQFGIIGMNIPGTFAEYAAVPASCIFPKPKHMTLEEASAVPLAFLTAWRMLIPKARLQAGETVLIHGIGGGVALAALIFAKAFNSKVIATSSSNEKLLLAKNLGADHLINYKTDNITKEVSEITNSKGVDVIIDSAGASTWPVNFECIKKGGRIALCGVTTGAKAETDLRALYWKQISIFGSAMGSRRDFQEMLKLINIKKIKPIIDSVYPMDQIQQAAQKMEEGKQFGKIVLKMKRD